MVVGEDEGRRVGGWSAEFPSFCFCGGGCKKGDLYQGIGKKGDLNPFPREELYGGR